MAFRETCTDRGSCRLFRCCQASDGYVYGFLRIDAIDSLHIADLSTMEHKLTTHQYRNLEAFAEDAQLVFDNCRLYNPEHTIYAKHADKLEKAFRELMP